MVTGSLLPRPLPRAAAFSMLAGVLFLIFMASAAPSPLYRVYQGEWRVSAPTPTRVFAGYPPLLLGPPLVFVAVAAYVGRPAGVSPRPGPSAGTCGPVPGSRRAACRCRWARGGLPSWWARRTG